MIRIIVLCYTLFLYFTQNEASRILAILPTHCYSHQKAFRSLTHELAKHHQVVVITSMPEFRNHQGLRNLTEIDIQKQLSATWDKFLHIGISKTKYDGLRIILPIVDYLVDGIFRTEEFKEIIDGKIHFDLLIIESWIRPLIILSHKLKVPMIKLSSFGNFIDEISLVGAPYHAAFYKTALHQRLFTSLEVVQELFRIHSVNQNYQSALQNESKWIKTTFGPDFPELEDLNQNVDLLFLNESPFWDNNRPVPPNVVYFGHLQEKPPQKVPKVIMNYLNSSHHGVVYVSFGASVPMTLIPEQFLQMLLNVLSLQLPYNVLMKWDVGELPRPVANIKPFKWLPQRDVLKHPNIKLFITQGGLQSTGDAIIAGVPLVGVPLIFDQWYNAEKYVHHGMGTQVDIDTVTEEELNDAIVTVLEDESYKQAMIGLSEMLRDQTSQALQRGIARIEYVLRHGAEQTRAPAALLSL